MMSAPANVANLAHDTSETINYDVTMDETPEPPDSTREARREDSQSAVVIPETSSNALENGDVIMEDPTVPLSSGSNTENLPTALDKKQCNAQVKLVSVGLTQQFLDELPKNVPLPDKDWFWVLNKARKQASCSVHIPLNDQMFIKTVIITSPTTLTFLANGKPLKLPNLQTTFKDHLSLYKAINRFSSAVLCQGLRDPSLKKIEPSNGSSATKNKDGTIRSNNCTIVSIPGNVCRKCKEVSAYLLKNVQRLLVKSARTKDEEKYLKRKISRYSTRLEVHCLKFENHLFVTRIFGL